MGEGETRGGKRAREEGRKGVHSITMLRMQLLISEISRSLRGVREARPILEGIEGSSYNIH
ncbi:MAG: hypothetical protein QXU98_04720 [Candidatus Parvarchaeota archaeon]